MSAALVVPQATPVGAHSFFGETTVTINYVRSTTTFYGSVISNRKICLGGRTVKLVRKWDGKRRVVATTTSNRHGNYKFDKPQWRGGYHVRVPRRVTGGYGHAHRCAFDRSPAI